MNQNKLREVSWVNYTNHRMAEPELREMLEAAEAFWIHDGNVAHPHAELTTGKCSDGFVDTLRALRFSNVCYIAAQALAKSIRDVYQGPIDWVIGSDHAGAVFSQNVAIWLNAQHDFTEKGTEKAQEWKRFKIKEGDVALQVEELMTTSDTFLRVREGIRRGNGSPVTFAPVAGVLIHRSSVQQIEDTVIVPFAHYDIRVWDGPDVCPLCKAGSKRLRPKQNWAELTRKA